MTMNKNLRLHTIVHDGKSYWQFKLASRYCVLVIRANYRVLRRAGLPRVDSRAVVLSLANAFSESYMLYDFDAAR